MPEYRVTVSVDQQAKARSKIGKDFNFTCFSEALKLKHKDEGGQEVPGGIVPTTAGDKDGKHPRFVANTTASSVDLLMKVVENDPVWTDEGQSPATVIVALADAVKGHEPDASVAIQSLEDLLKQPSIDQAMAVTVIEKRGKKKSDAPLKSATLYFNFHFELSTIYKDDKAAIRLRGRKFELKVNEALDALMPTVDSDRTIDRAAACALLMSTANHETKFVSCNQDQGGVAKAIIQMEPSTYNHLWDKGYIHDRPAAADALRRLAGVAKGKPDIAYLSSNDAYAAGMAFVRYLDNKAGLKDYPFPGVDQVYEQSRFWGWYYQCKHVEAKMNAYFTAWHRVFGPDSQDAPIPEIVPTPGAVPVPTAEALKEIEAHKKKKAAEKEGAKKKASKKKAPKKKVLDAVVGL